jgi:hypothetical protein
MEPDENAPPLVLPVNFRTITRLAADEEARL